MDNTPYYSCEDIKKIYGLESEVIMRLVAQGKLKQIIVSNKYVIEIDKFLLLHPSDLLTYEEEKQFLEKVSAAPSTIVAGQFLQIHYPIIKSITKQYDNRGIEMDKLVNIAMTSMRMALRKFSPDLYNERFSIFASKCITHELEEKIQNFESRRNMIDRTLIQQKYSNKAAGQPKRSPRDNGQIEAIVKLRAIKDMSPRRLYEKLEELGYVGQDETRRKLCLMGYRHIRRLKDHYLKKIPLQLLAPKANVLMVGPTGCGKSYLTKLLFENIIGVPVASIDITGFTEVGYVGRNVSEILSDLLNAADGDKSWAKMGVCVLDEFDKIASCTSAARFSGGGTTKDVSGYGVQRELLKLIEGGRSAVSNGGSSGPQSCFFMETDCIGFVACGAFSGIKELALRENGGSFGFKTKSQTHRAGSPDYQLEKNEVRSIEIFSQYGFMPELIGRFNSIMTLSPLDESVLTKILRKNVLPSYVQEFSREGLDLKVPDNILEDIVSKATSRKTGARGLALELTEYIEQQAFESFGSDKDETICNPVFSI